MQHQVKLFTKYSIWGYASLVWIVVPVITLITRGGDEFLTQYRFLLWGFLQSTFQIDQWQWQVGTLFSCLWGWGLLISAIALFYVPQSNSTEDMSPGSYYTDTSIGLPKRDAEPRTILRVIRIFVFFLVFRTWIWSPFQVAMSDIYESRGAAIRSVLADNLYKRLNNVVDDFWDPATRVLNVGSWLFEWLMVALAVLLIVCPKRNRSLGNTVS